MFHVSLKAQTPVSTVLTLADRIMFGIYGIISTSFAVSTLILVLHRGSYPHTAHIIFALFRPIGPGFSMALLASTLLSYSRLSTFTAIFCVLLAAFDVCRLLRDPSLDGNQGSTICCPLCPSSLPNAERLHSTEELQPLETSRNEALTGMSAPSAHDDDLRFSSDSTEASHRPLLTAGGEQQMKEVVDVQYDLINMLAHMRAELDALKKQRESGIELATIDSIGSGSNTSAPNKEGAGALPFARQRSAPATQVPIQLKSRGTTSHKHAASSESLLD